MAEQTEFQKQFGADAPAIALVRYFEDNAAFCTAQVLRLQGLGDYTVYGPAIKEYDTVAKVWESAAQAARTMLKVPNLDPEKCDCGKGDACPLWEHGMPSATALEMRDVRVAKRRRAESIEAARERAQDRAHVLGDDISASLQRESDFFREREDRA